MFEEFRPTSHHARRGFSLVELLIVLAIMAVVAGLAAPRYANSLALYRANAAAQRVATDLAFAKDQARNIGSPVTVTFVVAASTYSLAGVERLTHGSGDYSVDLTAEPYGATLVSASFGSGAEAVFNIYGMPAAGGQVVVRAGGVTRTVTLEAVTGKVTVQ